MILFRNSLETIPVGRDIKRIKADFLDGTIPSWLTVPSGTVVENNGMSTTQIGSISSMPFVIRNNVVVNNTSYQLFTLESVAIRVSNWRMERENNDGSVKLVSSNGVVIGVYGENSTNFFRVYPNGEDGAASIEDEVAVNINGSPGAAIVRVDQIHEYTSRPKNIEIVLQPEIGHFHFGINGGVAYTYWDLESANIDWSGIWHFEIESTGLQRLSSLEVEIQQNI
jgi:hypothetical protein